MMARSCRLSRIILWAVFIWVFLALSWAFLPSPTSENDDGSASATAKLRCGHTLTRVYPSEKFKITSNRRSAFALDYTFDPSNLTLSVSGLEQPIPIIGNTLGSTSSEEQLIVSARAGDQDGANLPWFDYADATLLYWWIHKNTIDVPIEVHRFKINEVLNLELKLSGCQSEPLLSIHMNEKDFAVMATVPTKPNSSSPSLTYPIRIVILHIVAPVAVLLTKVVEVFLGIFGDFLMVIFVVGIYGFMISAIIVSLWKCFGGPGLESIVARMQGRLEVWKQNERLSYLPLDALQVRLGRVFENERFKGFLYICANGWHPEREAAKAAELAEQTDIEKGGSDASKS